MEAEVDLNNAIRSSCNNGIHTSHTHFLAKENAIVHKMLTKQTFVNA